MINKDVVIPKGFLISVAEGAIKKPGRKDMTLIYSTVQAQAAGVFTKNTVKAAPVIIDMERMQKGFGRALFINSGNANACTGKKGMNDVLKISAKLAKLLKIPATDIFICSTGVIGTPLPMDRITPKIPELAQNLGKSAMLDAASAIMTTDTFPKLFSTELKLGKTCAALSAIAKGSGMISPSMATMLSFAITDAAITTEALKEALSVSVNETFNSITVDGQMSTNDTVIVLANGIAGNKTIESGTKEFKKFQNALTETFSQLSDMIVRDGEGATKFITVEVMGAPTTEAAKAIAKEIANSALVKTAIYGQDANWGRIMAAMGASDVQFEPYGVDISFNNVKVVRKGLSTDNDSAASAVLKEKEILITVNLSMGKSTAKIRTCDLTEEYIKINAEYRT
ncbi:bifunctional glutamate N-acetyltransferase/amino-acid acetyltransferase ArgJ [Candidatus Magnetomonas plexicatena]|uniref:bifunctional glutamate N-acetyltransferase/amino-acid acetyltransferase ArgJ n=1 Tax=Candidatus Magnetomonas plexicatena TaxID=2552947 RepID=UPI001100FB64|nr:bifunctional glutamate N-acetyltransferase/amino-acid acetyltransferase ArgJ [Nitrospirales bacterium LBB_01]